ncbi:hypothetical protein ABPG74_022117 [Tetrahymena malaccensis]
MDINKEIEFPFCKKHKIERASFLQIKIEEQDNVFKCAQCVLDDNQTKDYLYINTIFNSQDDYIFQNWPPISNQQLINDLIELVQDQSDPIQMIEDQFNNFINEFMQKIQQKKKQVLQCLQQLYVDKAEIQNIYKKLSSKDELQTILKQKVDLEKMNMDLKKFFFKSFEKKKQTNASLQLLVQRIKYYQDFPKMFNLEQHKNSIFEQLDLIDEKIENSNLFRERLGQQQQELNLLIQSQNQTDRIINDSLINKFNENLININQVRLLNKKEKFSDLCQSKLIKVTYDINKDIISIYKCQDVHQGYIYFSYQLQRNKKYIVRVRFNDKGGKYIIFGLVDQYLENLILKTKQGKSFGDSDTKYGGKIVQGSYFNEMNKDIIIEMRIDIQNQQIQFENNEKSINELQPECLLDANKIYYLTFYFGKLKNQLPYETLIDIIYFQEVDHF